MQIMQSEIDNIMKGIVVQTPDYISSKRVIGIGQATVIDQNGQCAPLSKQSAFTNSLEENVQSETIFNDNLNTLDVVPNTSENSINLNTTIPEFETPVNVDNSNSNIIDQSSNMISDQVLSDTPVAINNPNGLENLLGDIPNIGEKVDTFISKTIDSQMSPYDNSSSSDIGDPVTLPKFDEPSVATVDPTIINDSLFNDSIEPSPQTNDAFNNPEQMPMPQINESAIDVTPTITNDNIMPDVQPNIDLNEIEEMTAFQPEISSTRIETPTINDNLMNDNIVQDVHSNDAISEFKPTPILQPEQKNGSIINNEIDNAILSAFERKKQDIALKISNYMTAASTMLLDEIFELIKEEMLIPSNNISNEKEITSAQTFNLPFETPAIETSENSTMTLNV